MSTSFDVYPTKSYIPSCDEIVHCAVGMFNSFLKRENVSCNLKIDVYERFGAEEVTVKTKNLIIREDGYNVFSLNQDGCIFVYCHKRPDLDKAFWEDELVNNKRAQAMKTVIDASLRIGYSWNIVRTAGQPILVSLFYGYLAIAIAKLTDGLIYSDDGAWEYSYFPIMAEEFEKVYLDVENIRNGNSNSF